jgi:hypothetical protein
MQERLASISLDLKIKLWENAILHKKNQFFDEKSGVDCVRNIQYMNKTMFSIDVSYPTHLDTSLV